MAYHGIALSSATAYALYHKYGLITNYGYDRQQPDSHGRILCGYTLQKGDKVVIIDDLMSSGQTLDERLHRLLQYYEIEIAAIIVIADRKITANNQKQVGSEWLAKKYRTKVYSIITDEDIQSALPVLLHES